MGWEQGSTTAWRRVRALVLARDGYRCRAHADGWCAMVKGDHRCTSLAPLTGGPGVAGHAHHTRGRDVTGDDPRFIVAACPACNLHIGNPVARAVDPPLTTVTRWGSAR